MTPHKSVACRKEIEIVLDFDMNKPSHPNHRGRVEW